MNYLYFFVWGRKYPNNLTLYFLHTVWYTNTVSLTWKPNLHFLQNIVWTFLKRTKCCLKNIIFLWLVKLYLYDSLINAVSYKVVIYTNIFCTSWHWGVVIYKNWNNIIHMYKYRIPNNQKMNSMDKWTNIIYLHT